MLKIFDCSNSEERPMNRNFGGPIQNEFVSLLHKHSNNYFVKFVDDVNECDIIFTNDIYPEYILEIDKPKVKRMDGIFWQTDLKERNEKYNKAAEQSDLVIFISEYSRNSYYKLYGNHLKKDIVGKYHSEVVEKIYVRIQYNDGEIVTKTFDDPFVAETYVVGQKYVEPKDCYSNGLLFHFITVIDLSVIITMLGFSIFTTVFWFNSNRSWIEVFKYPFGE